MSPSIKNIKDFENYIHIGMKFSATIEFIADNDYTFYCELIGMKKKNSFIIDIPNSVLEDLLVKKLNDADIILRGVSNSELAHIIALRSTVLAVTNRPYWLMHIRLPNQFECIPVRHNRRYKVDIPVQIEYQLKSFKGTLLDISSSGCAIQYNGTTALRKGNNITLHFLEQDLEPRLLDSIQGKVLNIKTKKNATVLGVLFDKSILATEVIKERVIEHLFF